MKKIHGIYIVKSDGTPIFIQDYHTQGSQHMDHILLTNFMNAFQSFATELGGEQLETIKFGDFKILMTKDQLTNIRFAIRADLKEKDKKLLPILRDIKNLFIQESTGKLYSNGEEKQKFLSSFEEKLHNLLNLQKNVESFLEKL